MGNIEIGLNAKDNASAQMAAVGDSAKELEVNITKVGVAMAAMGAAIAAALALTVKSFAEEEKGIIRLRVAMRNVGLDYDLNTEAIERQISALQYKTGVADDEQRDSLASLVRITRDTAAGMDLLELSMDVAIGTGRDLTSATTLLMYALSGNWGMLERYIPAIKEAADEEAKWAMLRELFAGQAEEYGASLAGQMDIMKAGIGDLSETIGGVLAPTITNIVKSIVELIKRMQEVHPLMFKMGTWGAAAAAGLMAAGAGLILMVTQLPKLVIAMRTTWAFMVGKFIPTIVMLTKVYAAQFVMAMAAAAASGQWWLVAAGIAAITTAAALASAAVAGLVFGIKELTHEETEQESIIHDVRQATIGLTDAIKEQNEAIKETAEIAKGMPAFMEIALEHMLAGYEDNIGTLNSEIVADLTSIKNRLVDTYGELPDELQPAFDGLVDRLGLLVDRGGSLTIISDLTAEMTAEFKNATEGADVLTAALAAMPAELKPALDEMLTMAETNLGGLSDAFLDTIIAIRDNLTSLYDIPPQLASRMDTLIDAELALDSAARVANAALSDQTIASLRAADAKGNLASAAEKLGFSEDEARQLIQEANLSMSDQQIAAHVAGEKKKSLAEIAEDLGKSESELAEILERANAGLETQKSLAASTASSMGTGGSWRVGTHQNIANMGSPAFDYAEFQRANPQITGLPPSRLSSAWGVGGGGGGGGGVYNTYVTLQSGAFMGNEQEAREFSRRVGNYINQDTRRHSSAVKI